MLINKKSYPYGKPAMMRILRKQHKLSPTYQQKTLFCGQTYVISTFIHNSVLPV